MSSLDISYHLYDGPPCQGYVIIDYLKGKKGINLSLLQKQPDVYQLE